MNLKNSRERLVFVLIRCFEKRIKELIKNNFGPKLNLRYVRKHQKKVWKNRKHNLGLTEKQMMYLHMFFSPLRIPEWLTKNQAMFCLYLGNSGHEDLEEMRNVLEKNNGVLEDDPFKAYLEKVFVRKSQIANQEDFLALISTLPEKDRKIIDKMVANVIDTAGRVKKMLD